MSATGHARRRFMQYLGEELDEDQWAKIVHHARAGHYPTERPRPRHPRHARRERRRRAKCPIYLVPVQDARILIWVPMVVNTRDGKVVTVLPPRPES